MVFLKKLESDIFVYLVAGMKELIQFKVAEKER